MAHDRKFDAPEFVGPSCRICKRQFAEGESGWVEDVKVITPIGVRLEQRYTCDDCEAKE